MERVSVREGDEAVIVLAPHGVDDDMTAYIAETLADNLDCYAVINRGWERAATVDFLNDKANCNNIEHLHEDVVREEFLEPIQDFLAKLRRQSYYGVYIFTIHGFSVPNSRPDIVLGWGNGVKPHPSCDEWRKTALGYFLAARGFEVYEGIGNYAGWSKKNLNQLFKLWYPDAYVQSMQLEIARPWRETQSIAEDFTKELTHSIELLLDQGDVPLSGRFKMPSFG
jgi:hypothetical protein